MDSSISKDLPSLNPQSIPANPPPEHSTPTADPEKQTTSPPPPSKKSVYANLGLLDRLLVLWILLAIIIGILLGNFVDSVGPALQRGKFVGVSVPIGMFYPLDWSTYSIIDC